MENHMRCLPVFFYNMTYDITSLVREGGFAWILYQICGEMPRALKNINQWLSLSTPTLKFLDICNYISGRNSLTDFLYSYGIPDKSGKFYFPYSELTEPADMMKRLPLPYDSFWSNLKQENVLETNRRKYDQLIEMGFEQKAALKRMKRTDVPEAGPELYEKIVRFCQSQNMTYLYEYLAYYCVSDVMGPTTAMERMKKSYFDMTTFITLPSLSYNWALKHISNWNAPSEGWNFVVKLDREAFTIIEEGIKGGSSTVMKRCSVVDLTQIREHRLPPEERQVVKNIGYFDFNMLYGSSAYNPMPVLGNYAVRKKTDNFRMDKVNGRGLMALGWLLWIGFVEKKKIRTVLSIYSEASLVLAKFKRANLDGWIITRKNKKEQIIGNSYEFHGKVVHSHPDFMTKEEFENGLNPINGKPNKQVYEETLERDRMISEHPLVEKHTVMWEHQWEEEIRNNPVIREFLKNELPKIRPQPIKEEMTWEELLELVCEEKVHGVIKCSLEVPEDQLERFSIYPPFWLHRKMDREQCCETEKAYAQKHRLLKTPTKTLCNEMSVTDSVTTTDMLKFYVKDLGLICTDITEFVQFCGCGKPLEEWADLNVEQRDLARINNEPIKGQTSKLMLNTFFGSSILKVERRRQVTFIPQEKLSLYYNRPGFDGAYDAGPVNERSRLLEVEMKKMNIHQTSSKQIGMWILQISKLKLLDFVYNVLNKYLRPECWEINGSDTDSIVLSVSTPGSDLRPIAKPELEEEFNRKYEEIFVCKPEDTHKPGLLKVEKEAKIFIGLASKTYLMIGDDPFHKQASKGISATKENEQITSVLNYVSTLFDVGEERRKAVIRGIRNDPQEHTLRTYELQKSGLARLAPKVGFFPCAICPFPRDLKDRQDVLERIYPYSCVHLDFDTVWNKIVELSQQYPDMHLHLE